MRAGGDTAEENVVYPIDFVEGDQAPLWSTRYRTTPDKSLKSLYRIEPNAFAGSAFWQVKMDVRAMDRFPSVIATLRGLERTYSIRLFLNLEDSSWQSPRKGRRGGPKIIFLPNWKLVAPWDALTTGWLRKVVDGDTILWSGKLHLGKDFFKRRRAVIDTVRRLLRYYDAFPFKEIIAANQCEFDQLLGCEDFPAHSDGLAIPPVFIACGPNAEPFEVARILMWDAGSVPRMIREGFARMIEDNPKILSKFLDSLQSRYQAEESIPVAEYLVCLSGYRQEWSCKEEGGAVGYLLCRLTRALKGDEGLRQLVMKTGGDTYLSGQNIRLLEMINSILGMSWEQISKALFHQMMVERSRLARIRRNHAGMREQ